MPSTSRDGEEVAAPPAAAAPRLGSLPAIYSDEELSLRSSASPGASPSARALIESMSMSSPRRRRATMDEVSSDSIPAERRQRRVSFHDVLVASTVELSPLPERKQDLFVQQQEVDASKREAFREGMLFRQRSSSAQPAGPPWPPSPPKTFAASPTSNLAASPLLPPGAAAAMAAARAAAATASTAASAAPKRPPVSMADRSAALLWRPPSGAPPAAATYVAGVAGTHTPCYVSGE